MRALFDLFLDICLFRRGPRDVPASVPFLQASLFIYTTTGWLGLAAGGMDYLPALFLILLDLVSLMGLTYGVITLLGWGGRFAQTLTALAGTGTLLQVLAIPVLIWLKHAVASHEAIDIPVLLWLLLLIWNIGVMAHILRHALTVSLEIALVGVIGYVIAFNGLSTWLFPIE